MGIFKLIYWFIREIKKTFWFSNTRWGKIKREDIYFSHNYLFNVHLISLCDMICYPEFLTTYNPLYFLIHQYSIFYHGD